MEGRKITVYCDGGARGNPGPAASAIVVVEDGKEIFKKGKFLGEATNNFAEYTALEMALQYLKDNAGIKAVDIYMDSELVVKQMKGEYKVKSKSLLPIFLKVKNLEKDLGFKTSFIHTLRSGNKEADRLVNVTINDQAHV